MFRKHLAVAESCGQDSVLWKHFEYPDILLTYKGHHQDPKDHPEQVLDDVNGIRVRVIIMRG